MKLLIRVLPRSARDMIVGDIDEGALKVKLTAAPVDGQANNALIRLLSKHLGVAKGKIKIIKGQTSKNKIVVIE